MTFVATPICLLVLVLTGCIPIPYKVKNPIEENDIEEVRQLENRELREHLGQPKTSYEFDDKTYQIYEYPPGSDVFPLMHPIGYLFIGGLALFLEGMETAMGRPNVGVERDPQTKEVWAAACLMIEFDSKNIIDAEAKPYEKHGCENVFSEKLLLASAEAREKGDRSAALFHAVWTNDVEAIRGLAEEGHLDAAIKLAEKTGDTKPLKELVTAGGENALEAAVAIKRLTGDDEAPDRAAVRYNFSHLSTASPAVIEFCWRTWQSFYIATDEELLAYTNKNDFLVYSGQTAEDCVVSLPPGRYKIGIRNRYGKSGYRAVYGLVELKSSHSYAVKGYYNIFKGEGLWLEDKKTGDIVLGSRKPLNDEARTLGISWPPERIPAKCFNRGDCIITPDGSGSNTDQ